MPRPLLPLSFLLVITLGFTFAEGGEAPKSATAPGILGSWTGSWGAFDPTTMSKIAKETCKGLDCSVVAKDGGWEATFEGECGGPYKYTIKMEGRKSGDAILFRGSVDLGEKGGGIYDWVGRANDKEFVGFYTSSRHVGVFQLARKK
jgi:hypothetical protein